MAVAAASVEHTLPVFVINNQLPAFEQKAFTTAEICAAAEKVSGYNSIEGAQRIGGLWRIYPRSDEGRKKLLIQGFALRGVAITVKSRNPYIVRESPNDPIGDRSTEQPPSTKLIIGNVPLSFSDTELLQAVKQLGATVLSKLIAERDRDALGKLTHWKTGRRFVYVTVPDIPFPRSLQVGPFRASVYHREQKTADRQQEAECRRCLTKGHRAGECQAPIKCRQCLQDGHKAGDAACCMVPPGARDHSPAPGDQLPDDPMAGHIDPRDDTTSTQTRDKQTNMQNKQTKDTDGANTDSTKMTTSAQSGKLDRSRPRIKQQAKLTAYRRSESGSVKRRHSAESCSSLTDKRHRRIMDQTERETDDDEDFVQCEPHTEWG